MAIAWLETVSWPSLWLPRKAVVELPQPWDEICATTKDVGFYDTGKQKLAWESAVGPNVYLSIYLSIYIYISWVASFWRRIILGSRLETGTFKRVKALHLPPKISSMACWKIQHLSKIYPKKSMPCCYSHINLLNSMSCLKKPWHQRAKSASASWNV